MKILAIDTSGLQAGIAVVENGKALGKIIAAAQTTAGKWKHSEILLPSIARLLDETRLTLADIGCVAYTCGPGSFTGLRIGAATALGLARGAGVPVVGVPTLDAMAYDGVRNSKSGIQNKKIVAMMDARRGQVYAAVYKMGADGKMERVTDYLAAPAEEIMEIAGDAEPVTDAVDPAMVGLWAMDNIHSHSAELLYIRAPQAVREREKC
ncbi:MAG: tRNA (adenosine(37)-N6)-threonylcarbamoyltransferase complex dimerization subunit type 1 TsaB [Defluviitaleaceae bacterium]|nr:tRNA (adenosine(37)-N6)-threonylcarbamoyltransferase complex dimerization subunit type 1 TsaB [Defluviitaleaceae bacterium]